MVLFPDPLGPASTRSRGWAGVAGFAGGLAAGSLSADLLDTLEDGAGSHALAHGHVLDDGGRAI